MLKCRASVYLSLGQVVLSDGCSSQVSRIDRFSDSHAECSGAGSSAAIGGRLDVMTGADGGADPGARPGWRWDVALSFAGAQRDYVEQVARR